MIKIGINTYVSLSEADKYISKIYRKDNPLRVYWSVLTDEEKERLKSDMDLNFFVLNPSLRSFIRLFFYPLFY